MSANKTGKRPLRSLTAHEKLEAIRRVHDGESKASVARDIGVPESTLRGWCKNEDKISYLSRQSSPETDESLEHSTQNKKPKLEESPSQPFNLSLKSSGGSFSDVNADFVKNGVDPIKIPTKETPKSSNSMTERERNRAELARLSVELGLNRPEMYIPALNNTANLADLTANIGLLTQWNSILMQQQQQQHQQQQKNQQQITKKITAPADTSTAVSSSGNLLTTVDQEKAKLLSREKQSVDESVWYWLKSQQSMMGLTQVPTTMPQIPTTIMQPTNGTSTPTTTTPNVNSSISPDQSSWFWRWYKQFAYAQQIGQQQTPIQETKPILYQELTKDVPQRDHTPLPFPRPVADQQNAENLSMRDDKLKSPDKANSKVRSVLDNLLFNNNINVSINKKDDKEDEVSLSQSEAVEHGEKFLKWLEACSDPSVTAVQIMQFRTLLNNVKSGADRKNGEIQNKAKVKRK